VRQLITKRAARFELAEQWNYVYRKLSAWWMWRLASYQARTRDPSYTLNEPSEHDNSIGNIVLDFIIRQPRTVVPGGRMFYGWCLLSFFLFSTRDLRAPSADRRKTLPRDRKLIPFYNPLTTELTRLMFAHPKSTLRAISDSSTVQSRMSLKPTKQSTRGKRRYQLRSLPRSTKI